MADGHPDPDAEGRTIDAWDLHVRVLAREIGDLSQPESAFVLEGDVSPASQLQPVQRRLELEGAAVDGRGQRQRRALDAFADVSIPGDLVGQVVLRHAAHGASRLDQRPHPPWVTPPRDRSPRLAPWRQTAAPRRSWRRCSPTPASRSPSSSRSSSPVSARCWRRPSTRWPTPEPGAAARGRQEVQARRDRGAPVRLRPRALHLRVHRLHRAVHGGRALRALRGVPQVRRDPVGSPRGRREVVVGPARRPRHGDRARVAVASGLRSSRRTR